MSTRESVASKKIKKQNSLSNNAQSYIRKSGRNAGFTGKKLSIFVMVITATLLAMIKAPTLASGIRTHTDDIKQAWIEAGYKGEIKGVQQNLNQKRAMTKLDILTLDTTKEAGKLALNQLQQAKNIEGATKYIAFKAGAINAFSRFFYIPVNVVSTLTGVSEAALNTIRKTGNNARRAAGAVTGTVAGASENVGATVRTVTGSMKNTANFISPFAFILTMVSIMAGATGVRASILKQITSMLSGMMSKGIPVTKSVLIKVFNMMYNDTWGKTSASNRITNVTNKKNNNNNKNTATSTGK